MVSSDIVGKMNGMCASMCACACRVRICVGRRSFECSNEITRAYKWSFPFPIPFFAPPLFKNNHHIEILLFFLLLLPL